MDTPWMTGADVAEYLRISPRTVQGWRLKRQGPPWYQVEGEPRYHRAEVIRWLGERRRDPQQGVRHG